jgi:hypothetical protein
VESPSWRRKPRVDGVITLSDAAFQQTWTPAPPKETSIDYNSPKGDFQVGLFPLHSPLLGESWLVSFPPLIDMLKFSGCSCLSSGRGVKGRKVPLFGGGQRPKPTIKAFAARGAYPIAAPRPAAAGRGDP